MRSQCLIKESYTILEMDNMIYYKQQYNNKTYNTHIAYNYYNYRSIKI